MSNSGANNLCVATMGVGTKHGFGKGIARSFPQALCMCVFVFFPARGLTGGVCLYLNSWVCFFFIFLFFLLLCSACLWLLPN